MTDLNPAPYSLAATGAAAARDLARALRALRSDRSPKARDAAAWAEKEARDALDLLSALPVEERTPAAGRALMALLDVLVPLRGL